MHNQSKYSESELKALAKAIKYINQHPPEWKSPGAGNENHFSRKTLQAFDKAIQYINKHPLEWTRPDEFSRYSDINQSTLQAVFLWKTGRTISEYCEIIRITVSCIFLADETLSTKEIAALCGYSSQSSFNKAFKRVKEVSPGKWMMSDENHSLGKSKVNLLDKKNSLLDKKVNQIDKQ
jgi:AraC-like DNA-binding protein